MQACSLSATNLACRRGDRVLFRGLGLELKASEALHITGNNGIGKTSLMRILAGLLRQFDGSVEHSGTLGLVDEKPALDPQLRLESALHFWGGLDGCTNIQQNCAVMGMDTLLDVPFRYLSTGQCKRAAFVRLLNQGTDIWLLDEPLNGLDADGIAKVEALIALHCGGGGICVAASHQSINLQNAKTLALKDYAA
ncbi:heme ABC exporter ATP-binding protein CcmA [Pontixanthobacter aestiaquae]|uniref:Heme ABC exporter ATP-binding protein CcmA n=1 Tax=Pontixanthobacter aestiaquae TaxID=1509367 RepID=A0A844Z2N9_9SPHN|nr:heme ABC exporter ATP-binding protein CcmA [Pontixanthobacter aestiaquae]MDN3646037.1 heme ABC exporter ATP-binding protein CcmA [Pontixanthobacter aestiaquae]MXO82971.1 heme ABC exporter ATP-binding protein CcmA [Pontixanthobacter aestiaquae]